MYAHKMKIMNELDLFDIHKFGNNKHKGVLCEFKVLNSKNYSNLIIILLVDDIKFWMNFYVF